MIKKMGCIRYFILGGLIASLLILLIQTIIRRQGSVKTYQTSPLQPPPPTPTVFISPSPTQKETRTSTKPNFYQDIPNSWLKYEDKEAGIAIFYPPNLIAKYNPNRGVGVNYAAGSYLLDQQGGRVLDFFIIPYKGGSRRKTLYKVWAFDGPYSGWQEYAKHTISSKEIILRGRPWLKLTTSLYREKMPYGIDAKYDRVFWLTVVGRSMFYFTFTKDKEDDPVLSKQLLTIIAHSQLTDKSSKSQGSFSNRVTCFPNPRPENENQTWLASIDQDGNLIIIQRTTKELKDKVDLTRIEALLNYQDLKVNSQEQSLQIVNFSVYRAPDQKGNYSDAFVVKIDKEYVKRLREKTPKNIKSIAVMLKINGGLQSTGGKECFTPAFVVYYAARQ